MKPGIVVYACHPSTQELEAGGSKVLDQPGLHSESVSQKQNKVRQHSRSPLVLTPPVTRDFLELSSSSVDANQDQQLTEAGE